MTGHSEESSNSMRSDQNTGEVLKNDQEQPTELGLPSTVSKVSEQSYPLGGTGGEKYWPDPGSSKELLWVDKYMENIPSFVLRQKVCDEVLLNYFHNYHAILNTGLKDEDFATLMNVILQMSPDMFEYLSSNKLLFENPRNGIEKDLVIPESLSVKAKATFNFKNVIIIPKTDADREFHLKVDDELFCQWYSDISNKKAATIFFALFSMASLRILTKSTENSMRHLQQRLSVKWPLFTYATPPPAFPSISKKFIDSYRTKAREDYGPFKSILADVIYFFHAQRMRAFRAENSEKFRAFRDYAIDLPLTYNDMTVYRLMDVIGNLGMAIWFRSKLKELKNRAAEKQFYNVMAMRLSINRFSSYNNQTCEMVKYARAIDKRFYSSLSNRTNKELLSLAAGLAEEGPREIMRISALTQDRARIIYFNQLFRRGLCFRKELDELICRGNDWEKSDDNLLDEIVKITSRKFSQQPSVPGTM